MTLVEASESFVVLTKDKAEEALNDFIGANKVMVTASIQSMLKKGEVVERASAKALMKNGFNQSQGAVVDIERMSVAQKFRILGRILGRRKITFSETICGQRIILDIRVLTLN